MIVRRLLALERDLIRPHLLRLAPNDRALRFCGTVTDLGIDQYCDQSERLRTETVGCFVDGDLRGIAELILPLQPDQRDAEIALSVEAPFQGRGVGGVLLRTALLHARNRLIGTVSFLTLAANGRMRRLSRRHGADVAVVGDMVEGTFPLSWPTQASLAEELAGEGLALIGRLFAQRRQTAASHRSLHT